MNIGVHVNHCCRQHGCKYEDDECPVVAGTHEQAYPCDVCEDVAQKLHDSAYELVHAARQYLVESPITGVDRRRHVQIGKLLAKLAHEIAETQKARPFPPTSPWSTEDDDITLNATQSWQP